MTSIDRAERKAMDCLSEWVNSMQPKFTAVEMQDLKRRMVAVFREYESLVEMLRERLK